MSFAGIRIQRGALAYSRSGNIPDAHPGERMFMYGDISAVGVDKSTGPHRNYDLT
jgi:hypothetical protein